MSHPATVFVLDAIKRNWSAGSFDDIPIARVNRDNSDELDTDIRSNQRELQESNYVSAAYVDRDDSPIGTEYDSRVDGLTIDVRIEGLHADEYGYIDPTASLPPTAGDAVPFYELHREIRDSILAGRRFPNTDSDIDYTDLQVTNATPLSYEHADYYRYDFDVVFAGYEEL